MSTTEMSEDDLFDEMSSSNTTTGGENEGSSEMFHIYILSFSYGLLLLVVFAHLIVRWQLRRRAVSHMRMHEPGDKSFKCKAMRQQLQEDFATIRKLSPDPTLINPNFEPSMYGFIPEGKERPSHWLRMQACEAAAAFVMKYDQSELQNTDTNSRDGAYSHHTQTRAPTRSEALPDFISRLQKKGLLCRGGAEGVASKSCDLYLMARFRDGTFTQQMWEEFQECLQQLHNLLSSQLGAGMKSRQSMSPDPDVSLLSTGQTPSSNRLSLQPLIAHGDSPPKAVQMTQASSSSEGKSRLHQKKLGDLSPLILVESPAASEHYLNPETPV